MDNAPWQRMRPAILILTLLSGTAWAGDAGTIKTVQGKVQVERAGAMLPLRVGDTLKEQDRIHVSGNSSTGFTLKDDTLISLGPDSTLLINKFTFNPVSQEGQVDTSILRGTLRYVTGLIGRLTPAAVRVDTPSSTIGIRGTEFIVEVGSGN